jgi:hypothetical protein
LREETKEPLVINDVTAQGFSLLDNLDLGRKYNDSKSRKAALLQAGMRSSFELACPFEDGTF